MIAALAVPALLLAVVVLVEKSKVLLSNWSAETPVASAWLTLCLAVTTAVAAAAALV